MLSLICFIVCTSYSNFIAAHGVDQKVVINIEQHTHEYGPEGTRQLLVNQMTQKMRGHSGKTIAQKSRNSFSVNGRSCGCIGTVNSSRNFAQS